MWKSLFPNLTKEMAVNKGTLSAISDKFTLVLITKVARRFTFWLCKYCHFHTSSIQTQTRQSTFLGCKAHSMSSKVESQMLFIAFLSFLEISECILQRDKRGIKGRTKTANKKRNKRKWTPKNFIPAKFGDVFIMFILEDGNCHFYFTN